MTRTLDGLESVLAVRELSSSPYSGLVGDESFQAIDNQTHTEMHNIQQQQTKS